MKWLNSAALMISKFFVGFIEKYTFCSLRWWGFLKTNLFHSSLTHLACFLLQMQFWLNKNAKTWVRRGQKVGFVAEQVCGKQKGLSNYSCSSSVVQGMSNIPHSILYKQSNDILIFSFWLKFIVVFIFTQVTAC